MYRARQLTVMPKPSFLHFRVGRICRVNFAVEKLYFNPMDEIIVYCYNCSWLPLFSERNVQTNALESRET